ncbi:MAG: hypothetical protein Q8P45_02790 [Candidatus Harrisonbacteria bacterium]|nr:hypothetical protein [Candidatus Harrisonbacteria bacterium]
MKNIVIGVLGAALLVGGFALVAQASHSWANYHWGRTANPFSLELGDNVSAGWDSHLSTVASDWSHSSVLDTVIKAGKSNRNCKGTDGRVEVCAAKYGFNGWLGIAQIWISSDHITKGVVKMNDSYFNTSTYNTPAWKNLVMCQEIGHTLGLGHTDENFENAPEGTCMDYSSDPSLNQHPNQHDYDMLEAMYAHLDSVDTVKSSDGEDGGGPGNGKGNGKGKNGVDIDLNDQSQWGKSIREDAQGNPSLFVRNLGGNKKVFTFVTWVDGHRE